MLQENKHILKFIDFYLDILYIELALLQFQTYLSIF